MSWARTAAPTPFLVQHGRRVVQLGLVPPVLSLLGLLKMAFWRASGRRALLSRVTLAALVGNVAAAVLGLLVQERRDERGDCDRDWHAAYAEWTVNEIELGRREDRQSQNHMVSVTQVKAGWLRLAVLRLVLLVLNFVARVRAGLFAPPDPARSEAWLRHL